MSEFTFNGRAVPVVDGPSVKDHTEDQRWDVDLTFHIAVMEDGGLYWVRRPSAPGVRDYLEAREGMDDFRVLMIVEGEFSHLTGEHSVWVHR